MGEDNELLRKILRCVSKEDRAILRMRYQDKCTHHEMADKLGWTERTVSRKMLQILGHLSESTQQAVP